MVMRATERNFCISCNESIKRRIPSGETWANPCSVNASFAGQCVSAGLRHLSWLQPQLSVPALYWTRRLGGSRALGQAGQCSQQCLELVRLLMEGRIFPPLKPPWCRDLLQDLHLIAWFCSGCPVPAGGMTTPECDGTRRDSPAGEVPPLGMRQGPPVPPGPQGCACCTGQGQAVAMAHSGPLTGNHYKVLAPNSGSCLALQGWRDAKGVGTKVLLTCCSETCIDKCSF